MHDVASISPAEAARLVEGGDVLVVDVRTPREFAALGHIPHAWLLPVDLIAAAPAVLPRDGRPILVCCEHAVRSVAAARWLTKAGVPHVLNMSGGMSAWSGPRVFEAGTVRGPSDWLLRSADLLPAGGRALDVASGRGRHAMLLAAAGFDVRAVDRDPDAIAALREMAARLGISVRAEVLDLETDTVDLGAAQYDVVLVFNYLHRGLVPALVRAVAPGGLLIYETFTRAQAERGRPTNPAFLLESGELPALVAPLVIERARESEIEGKMLASVAARKA